MRVQIEAKELKRAISVASSPVKNHARTPLAACLSIVAEENRLYLRGTDMDVEVLATCTAAVSQSGAVSASCADLRALSQRLTGVVDLSTEASRLTIKCPSGSWSLFLVDGPFPLIGAVESVSEIDDGIRALKECPKFCATDPARPSLHGVIFGKDSAAASNGEQFFLMPSTGGGGQIVPVAGANIAAKHAERLFLGDKTWRAEAEGVTITGRLLDYPAINWEQLIFNEAPLSLFDADEMFDAISSATLGRAERCVVSSDGEFITLTGEKFSGQPVEAESKIPCDGKPFRFTSSTKYLSSCVGAFSGSVVGLSSDGRAVMCKPEGAPGLTLFMPLRDTETNLEA